jgi:hypothetical protein
MGSCFFDAVWSTAKHLNRLVTLIEIRVHYREDQSNTARRTRFSGHRARSPPMLPALM